MLKMVVSLTKEMISLTKETIPMVKEMVPRTKKIILMTEEMFSMTKEIILMTMETVSTTKEMSALVKEMGYKNPQMCQMVSGPKWSKFRFYHRQSRNIAPSNRVLGRGPSGTDLHRMLAEKRDVFWL
jgi:hypothetical protein